MSNFTKVKRLKSKLRMALMGTSGAGKTLGALYIAYGITGDWEKIAVIDTEHERARLYANRIDLGIGEFLYNAMGAPYTPDKYKERVKEAAELVGEDGVVIVDSFSHAWNNEGGVLDYKDKIAAKPGKNGFNAWNEAGKVQNNLVNTILSVDCHTIVTMRQKTDYVMQENERGKQTPVKVGLAPVQREDVEYEFDIVLDIARNHIATTSKDVTFLDTFSEMITIDLGKQLKEWLDTGQNPLDVKGNEPLNQLQMLEIYEASGQSQDICKIAYSDFGYAQAKDIKLKDFKGILESVKRLAANVSKNDKSVSERS